MSTSTVPWPELEGGGCQIAGAFPETSFSIPWGGGQSEQIRSSGGSVGSGDIRTDYKLRRSSVEEMAHLDQLVPVAECCYTDLLEILVTHLRQDVDRYLEGCDQEHGHKHGQWSWTSAPAWRQTQELRDAHLLPIKDLSKLLQSETSQESPHTHVQRCLRGHHLCLWRSSK